MTAGGQWWVVVVTLVWSVQMNDQARLVCVLLAPEQSDSLSCGFPPIRLPFILCSWPGQANTHKLSHPQPGAIS